MQNHISDHLCLKYLHMNCVDIYLQVFFFLFFFAAFGLFFHLFQGYTVCPWCDLCRMPTPTESSNCPEFHPFVEFVS